MLSSHAIFVVLEFFVGLLALAVAYLAWNYRDKPAGHSLFVMAVTAVIYAFVSTSSSVVTEPTIQHLLHSLLFPLTTIIAIGSLYVAINFTERHEYLSPAVSLSVLGLVVLGGIAAVTDPVHNLFLAEYIPTTDGAVLVYGPLFWIYTIISLGIILASTTVLAIEFTIAKGIYREQIAALLFGFLIGVGFFLWEVLAPISPRFNLATVGIVGWSGTTLWGLFRANLLKTAPIARKSLIKSMDDAVFAISTDDRVVDLNPAARNEFDVDSDSVGRPVTEVLAEYSSLLEPIETRASEREVALAMDSDERYFDINTSPVTITQAKPGALGSEEQKIGHTIVIREITARKRREQELKRQNERLDEFASVVSHDLRSPLSVASGRLELAREESDSKHFDAIETALDRIDRIAEDVLWLAREGRDIGSLEAVSIQDTVEAAWDMVADNADEAELVVGDDRLASAMVKADYDRFYQLLENVLRNAIEHAGEDVTITIGMLNSGFYIEDDGPGIPEDSRKDVFTAGYSTSEEGIGFGLRIVKQVADALGWEIRITDGSEGGARFEITNIEFVE